MKGYRITLNGQTFEVEVLSDPSLERVQVRVDGETFTVEVASVAPARQTEPDAAKPSPSSAARSAPASVQDSPVLEQAQEPALGSAARSLGEQPAEVAVAPLIAREQSQTGQGSTGWRRVGHQAERTWQF